MSFTSWVDARLANLVPVLAPAVAKAIVAESGPLVTQVEAATEQQLQKAVTQLETGMTTAVGNATANLPAEIVTAIKGLLPFPL
jgi:hypothetical protein